MYRSILGHGCRIIHMILRSTVLLYLSQSESLQIIMNRISAPKFLSKIIWGARVAQYPPTITYMEAMDQDNRGLFKWLTNIVSWLIYSCESRWCVQDRFGFSFVSGVPPMPEATERLVERIGFIRETQCKHPISDQVTFWQDYQKMDASGTLHLTLPEVTLRIRH